MPLSVARGGLAGAALLPASRAECSVGAELRRRWIELGTSARGASERQRLLSLRSLGLRHQHLELRDLVVPLDQGRYRHCSQAQGFAVERPDRIVHVTAMRVDDVSA